MLGVLSPLLLLLVHGFLYNFIGQIVASRGQNYGPLAVTGLDAHVPFVPVFVLPYMFVWVFPVFLIGYLACRCQYDPEPCKRLCVPILLLMLICYGLWILFPVRCDLRLNDFVLSQNGILGELVRLNYLGASHWNACPSFHVAGPWFLYRAVRRSVPGLPSVFLIMVLCIAASTVLIRIHFLADIVCGVFVGEMVYRFTMKQKAVVRDSGSLGAEFGTLADSKGTAKIG